MMSNGSARPWVNRPRGRVLAESLSGRLRTVEGKHRSLPRPRVLCLEWLSPLYVGGHWVPEMVEIAGGQDVLGCAGQPSRQVSWQEVHAAAPQVVVLMPCGFSIERTVADSASCAGLIMTGRNN